MKTHSVAVIEGLFLQQDPEDFYTTPKDGLEFSLEPNGIVGDERNAGNTRPADVRAPAYRKKQDEVLNRQSVSVVGAEDLSCIAHALGLNPDVLWRAEAEKAAECGPTEEFDRMVEDVYDYDDPGRMTRRFLARCLGANVLIGEFHSVDGTEFRDLDPGVDFGPHDGAAAKFTDATIMITRANGPCIHPGQKIVDMYPGADPELAKRFVVVAQGRRGFVGMVAKGGTMTTGQVVAFIPYGER